MKKRIIIMIISLMFGSPSIAFPGEEPETLLVDIDTQSDKMEQGIANELSTSEEQLKNFFVERCENIEKNLLKSIKKEHWDTRWFVLTIVSLYTTILSFQYVLHK